MIISSATDNFKNWACSFSGCDGGDPYSEIWLCGIEWGYAKEKGQTKEQHQYDLAKYYREDLAKEITEGHYTPKDRYIIKNHLTYPFGIKVAKLYAAIKGHQTQKYEEVANDCKDSEIFKMNLYPIAFPNTDDGLWDKYGLTKITGLPSKEIYRTWCFLHRFPAINKQVTNYSPKYIIATGISYLTDFVVCFSGEKSDEMIHKEEIMPQSEANKSIRNFYWRRLNQKTILVVTPFFGGPNGMNSDYLLQQLGERTRNLNTT